MFALAENGLSSKVRRGENSGLELGHSAVTRKLIKIGSLDGDRFETEQRIRLGSTWRREHLKAVLFVQERTSRRVLGATAVSLAGD